MPGLSAKVFRTYNASVTLEEQLPYTIDINIENAEKVRLYNTANREVAILCNHQRTVPKQHETSMKSLEETKKVYEKQLKELNSWLKYLTNGKKIPLKPETNEKKDDNKSTKKLTKEEEAEKKRIEKLERLKISHMFAKQPDKEKIKARIALWCEKISVLNSNIKDKV